MNIGERIKEARLKQNITMNELARRSDIAQSGLSEIEAGNRLPTYDNLERIITRGLYIPMADFFSDTEPELSPQIRQLIDNAKALTPEQLAKLTEFIKTIK